MEIKKGSQVTHKSSMRRPEDGKIVKTGVVISIQGSSALVQFPMENVRRTVPVSDLQLTSERFPGRSSISFNPVHRH